MKWGPNIVKHSRFGFHNVYEKEQTPKLTQLIFTHWNIIYESAIRFLSSSYSHAFLKLSIKYITSYSVYFRARQKKLRLHPIYYEVTTAIPQIILAHIFQKKGWRLFTESSAIQTDCYNTQVTLPQFCKIKTWMNLGLVRNWQLEQVKRERQINKLSMQLQKCHDTQLLWVMPVELLRVSTCPSPRLYCRMTVALKVLLTLTRHSLIGRCMSKSS